MSTNKNLQEISIRENGPLIAKNVKNFRLPDGTLAGDNAIRALCRCGQSKNKPYCDGSHNEAGFDGSLADKPTKPVHTYIGSKATIHYNKILCSHAGECVRGASAVFNPKARPWVNPDQGSVEQLKAVVAACPSGALRLSDPGKDPVELSGTDVSITVEKNGPLWVQNIPLLDVSWAEGQSHKKYVLCRCGLSKNKPFCDGTHLDAGWRDD